MFQNWLGGQPDFGHNRPETNEPETGSNSHGFEKRFQLQFLISLIQTV